MLSSSSKNCQLFTLTLVLLNYRFTAQKATSVATCPSSTDESVTLKANVKHRRQLALISWQVVLMMQLQMFEGLGKMNSQDYSWITSNPVLDDTVI